MSDSSIHIPNSTERQHKFQLKWKWLLLCCAVYSVDDVIKSDPVIKIDPSFLFVYFISFVFAFRWNICLCACSAVSVAECVSYRRRRRHRIRRNFVRFNNGLVVYNNYLANGKSDADWRSL